MNKYENELCGVLIEINQYLNRVVINREIFYNKLMSEAYSWTSPIPYSNTDMFKPSEDMINLAKNIASIYKENRPKNRRFGFLDAFAIAMGGKHIIPKEVLKKNTEFLKSRGIKPTPGFDPESTLVKVIYGDDYKKINTVIRTLNYLQMRNIGGPNVDYLFKTNYDLMFFKKHASGSERYAPRSVNFMGSPQYISNVGKDQILGEPIKRNDPIRFATLKSFLGRRYSSPNSDQRTKIIKMVGRKDKSTLGHEFGHDIVGGVEGRLNDARPNYTGIPEMDADVSGAYYYLGQPDKPITAYQAIKANQKTFDAGSELDYDKIKYFKDKVDLAISTLENNKKSILERRDIKPLSRADKRELRKIVKALSILKQNKEPIRYQNGFPVYSKKVNDVLYRSKLFDDSDFDVHPSNIDRANYVLHKLCPKIFTEDGIDLRTGKPVDFSLKGKVYRTLVRAKKLGKVQLKVAVRKLKRSFKKSVSDFKTTTVDKLNNLSNKIRNIEIKKPIRKRSVTRNTKRRGFRKILRPKQRLKVNRSK